MNPIYLAKSYAIHLIIFSIKNDEENDYGYAYSGNYYPTFDVRDNDFEVTFTYKSNNEEFEHVLKIVEYENSTYGSAFSSDYSLTYSSEITDNKFINALNTSTRLKHICKIKPFLQE